MFIVEKDDKPTGVFETADEAAEWASHHLGDSGKAWAVRRLNVVQPNIWEGLMYKSCHLGATLICFAGLAMALLDHVSWRMPMVPTMMWFVAAFVVVVIAAKPP